MPKTFLHRTIFDFSKSVHNSSRHHRFPRIDIIGHPRPRVIPTCRAPTGTPDFPSFIHSFIHSFILIFAPFSGKQVKTAELQNKTCLAKIMALRHTTPFCVTGWPIVDNQLNSTFGNRHSLQPIGGIHYWLAYQQKRLDSNWPFCKTLRQ